MVRTKYKTQSLESKQGPVEIFDTQSWRRETGQREKDNGWTMDWRGHRSMSSGVLRRYQT